MKYQLAFFKSSWHVYLLIAALLAIGTAHWLGLIVGLAIYLVGWVNLPTSQAFRSRVDERENLMKATNDAQALANFKTQLEQALAKLTQPNRLRYTNFLAQTQTLASQADLGAVIWAYLHLLITEQQLITLLSESSIEQINSKIKQLELEVSELVREEGKVQDRQLHSRTLDSKQQALSLAQERLLQYNSAQANLKLVRSEQDRMEQQIQLLKAQQLQSKNVDPNLLNTTLSQLATSQRWLQEVPQGSSVLLPVRSDLAQKAILKA